MNNKPNILFVFADQWRADAFGYAGNPDCQTPHIDRFEEKAINIPNAISSCPVCSPYRGSLLTGTYPLHNGVFTNDVTLDTRLTGIGTAFKDAGFDTAYIGKWHVHGQGRSGYIPPEHRCGFDYWKVLECTHTYMNSKYYDNEDRELKTWDGYDADAQTADLIGYLSSKQDDETPFCAFLSWGPPHAPEPCGKDTLYDAYPSDLEGLYQSDQLTLRPNVPDEEKALAGNLLAGYYSHCTALDRDFGKIVDYLDRSGLRNNTIIVFTSDHGDSLGSQGLYKKLNPFRESIIVPFLIQIPEQEHRVIDDLILAPEDIMPTLLSLCGIPVPDEVDGTDCSPTFLDDQNFRKDSEIFALYNAFAQWRKGMDGGPHGFVGREYRGLKTPHYSYVVDRRGPWLLFDDLNDPYQLNNLIEDPKLVDIRMELDAMLTRKLKERNDTFEDGETYTRMWNYETGDDFAVIYKD